MVDQRQTRELRGCSQEGDALGRTCHGALREQPSRGFASADTATRTTDAEVQIRCSSSTVSVRARRRPESLQPEPAPPTIRELPVASDSCLWDLERGSNRLREPGSGPELARIRRRVLNLTVLVDLPDRVRSGDDQIDLSIVSEHGHPVHSCRLHRHEPMPLVDGS